MTTRYIPTADDEAWVHNQLVKYLNENNQGKSFQKNEAPVENHTGESKLLWVARMLVSWTFTKGGLPMPLSLAAIRKMRLSYIDYIYDEIMKLQPTISNEEETDFLGDAASITAEKKLKSVK